MFVFGDLWVGSPCTHKVNYTVEQEIIAEKEQSNRLKSSLTEHRYFTCFGINLYDNLVLFQSVVDSIRSPSAFPIEGTDHNIRFVDHISIAGKKHPRLYCSEVITALSAAVRILYLRF